MTLLVHSCCITISDRYSKRVQFVLENKKGSFKEFSHNRKTSLQKILFFKSYCVSSCQSSDFSSNDFVFPPYRNFLYTQKRECATFKPLTRNGDQTLLFKESVGSIDIVSCLIRHFLRKQTSKFEVNKCRQQDDTVVQD